VTLRRPELDGLRGVSVLDFRGLGRTGVFLFFVLSSYLLTDQLLARGAAELRRPRTWGRYAARRLLRVYPGYCLALGVTLALGGLTLHHALLHLALVRAEAHFWTIPVEVLFYLVLPPLALVLTALPRASAQAALLAVGLVAARLAWPPDYPAKAPDFRPSVLPFLVVFLAGSLTAVLARSGWFARGARVTRALAPLGAIGFAALTPALASLALGEPVEHTRFHLWFGTQAALASLVVLGLVVHGGAFARVLSNAPLRFVGRASYSVYLLHALPLAYVLERGVAGAAGAWLILVASLVLGAVGYLLVERPFLRL